MIAQTLARRTPQLSTRSFSVARTALSNQSGGPFDDRERAQENVYIKKQENERLKKLREKLEEHKDSINKLEEEIKKIKK